MAQEIPTQIRTTCPKSLPRAPITAIQEATSILMHNDVRDMKFAFPCLNDYYYSVPDTPAITKVDRNTLVVPLDHFTLGLCFPLHHFISDLLLFYELFPAQLTTNSIAQILSFIVMCRRQQEKPTFEVFDAYCRLRKEARNTGY
ncbi:hypothetical protein Dimus_031595 [Dionaea muscipula]